MSILNRVMPEQKRLDEFTIYDKNPFELRGITDRLDNEDNEGQLVYNEDGEVFILKPAANTAKRFVKDRFPYRKVYLEGVDILRDLSHGGLKVVLYILSVLKKHDDIAKLDKKEVSDFCSFKSRSQYYRAVVDLLDKNILVRSSVGKDNFFINVNIIFNGNRGFLYRRRERE